ncbi:conditioned medium-induced protein 4 [Salinirubellus salinus]|uniref:Conditioned medium-induced protein 4 n=1 Tax=Salinirubellus salinus TaxID=1364945 RepID=A0A9E7R1R8_9EURY|nr:conditioned medium-induced protein 4 [Salinirubellus salinus]UWM54155.1 conditioned medium-induced protein 4 [Salinirubellus salinus]
MDEKTAELRDIFVNVTESETVTERQEEARGSLAGDVPEDREERIHETIAELRERCAFDTTLDDDALVTVVVGFFEGESDTDIAAALDEDRRTVVRARLALHLLRDRDTDAPFDLERLRSLLADGSVADAAAELDVSESTVRRYRRVLDAQAEERRVSGRFRAEFEDLFTDAAAEQLTADVKESGLEDATEDAESESNVSM